MGDALERQQVMLAEAHQLDVADQHEFLVVGLERRGEHLRRVDPQAGEELRVRAGDAGRGALETVAVRVLTDGDEDLPDRLLDAGQVDGLLDRGAGELAVDQTRGEVVGLVGVVGLRGAAVGDQRFPSTEPFGLLLPPTAI
ncbi:hypothetical protein GCM10020358_47400 [Amorphoplanes nipponensis]|uniref:Uncharacterized protein n=1 Tax=Actinoplanes nipponensis TaxID=135950 RepID=A0A919JHL4_9ACTN|nr:hypothetical protein Ani05nite_29740 [Actinoplanes nipponensis]